MNSESNAPKTWNIDSEMERKGKEKFLVVDDEAHIRKILVKQLQSLGYYCHTANDGIEALRKIKDDTYNLVFLDIDMPRIRGDDVLKTLKEINSDIPVIMISSLGYADIVRKTLREGAFDYLVKPWDFNELKISAMKALEHGRLLAETRQYHRNLEREVEKRTKKLNNALKEIKRTYDETILALGSALETRDIETQAHSLRVSHYSYSLAKELGIENIDQLTDIEKGAYLHDIGKIGVPDHILRKPEALTDEEWIVMKRHPEIGKKIIERIEFLKGAIKVVYYHHEYFNGSGYPQGLVGEKIPMEARIFSVADAFDALITNRPYRKALSVAEAKKTIISESEEKFDPRVVEAFKRIVEQFPRTTGE